VQERVEGGQRGWGEHGRGAATLKRERDDPSGGCKGDLNGNREWGPAALRKSASDVLSVGGGGGGGFGGGVFKQPAGDELLCLRRRGGV